MIDPDRSDQELSRRDRTEITQPEVDSSSRTEETPVTNPGAWLLAIAAVALLVLGFGFFRNADAQDGVSADGVRQLHIDAGSSAVEIIAADTAEITAELSGNNRNLSVNRSGNTVEIGVDRSWWPFRLFSFRGSALQVTIPKRLHPAVELHAGSGRVKLDDLVFNDVNITSSSGRVCLDGLTVTGNLSVRTSSGRVCLQDSTVSHAVNIRVSSATIHVEDTVAASYELSSSSGRIEASGLPGTEVIASTSSGRIDLGAEELREDWSLRSSSGRIEVTVAQVPRAMRLDFRGSSGRARIADRYGFDFGGSPGNSASARVGTGGPLLHVRTSSGGFELN